MGGLFSSGSNSSTSESDPFKNMPRWMRKALEKDADFRQDLLKDAGREAEYLGDNPREILGLDDMELGAADLINEAGAGAGELGDMAKGMLGQDYESGYTDDVVDTTLAGMQRQAQRDQLARDGRAAAVGGTSNSRAAVGDAVAGQLTGMNMAEMEAKLRDEGFRFGSEMNLQEAGLADQFANSELNRGLQHGGAIGMIGEKGRELEQGQLDADRGANQEALSWLGNLFSGTNTGYGPTGGTQTSTQPAPSTFSQILGAGATIAGGMLSDADAKEDIVSMEHGLDALKDVTPTTYRYKEDAPTGKKGRTAGLIAQDLEHIPGAVEMRDDGYRQVDPYPVLATVVQAVKELDARTG